MLNWLYGCFVLPESHAKENRRPFDWTKANPLASFNGLRRYPLVFGLAFTILCERLAHDVLPTTWVLYTTWRFHWSERDNGLSLSLVGLVYVIVAGVLTGKIVGALGEKKTFILGLAMGVMTFVGYGLATQGWMLYAFIVLGSLGGVAMPAIQAIISKNTPADVQGAVQGAITSINSLAAVFGPLLATFLFGYFTSPNAAWHLPGAAFLAGAVLITIGALNALVTMQRIASPTH